MHAKQRSGCAMSKARLVNRETTVSIVDGNAPYAMSLMSVAPALKKSYRNQQLQSNR